MKKAPSDMSALDLIKYLNGRRGWLNLDGTCSACKRVPIHPEIGFVFRNGGIGECTVTKVWESRFGDWKVSYADKRGGGGMINLDYFTERFAPSESQREAAESADEKPDGQAENAGSDAPGAIEKP